MTEQKKLNIYQKLLEVRWSVDHLKKNNKGYEYSYVSSSQTISALRQKMNEEGLLLVPQVNSYEVRENIIEKEYKGNIKKTKWYFTILNMSFTWVNVEYPTEVLICPWTGQGLDTGEKGVGKALTYAEKYFLLKFFNIPTDKDDPDAHQEPSNQEQQFERCPNCGGELYLREVKKAGKNQGKKFVACSNYPKCDYSCWDIDKHKKGGK